MYQSAVSFPHPFFFEFCQQRRRSRIFFFYFFCEVHTFLVSPNCGSHDSTVFFFALWTPCAKSVGVAGPQFVCVCVRCMGARFFFLHICCCKSTTKQKKEKKTKQNKIDTITNWSLVRKCSQTVPPASKTFAGGMTCRLSEAAESRNRSLSPGPGEFFFAETSFWTTLRVKNLVLI